MANFCYECYKIIWECEREKEERELEMTLAAYICMRCGQRKSLVKTKANWFEIIDDALLHDRPGSKE